MVDTFAARSATPLNVGRKRLGNLLVEQCASASGIPTTLIKYGGREMRLTRLRWAIMYALRHRGEGTWSYPTIASFFLMDHTTVMHGVIQCERLMATDEEYSTFVAALVESARHG